MGFIINPYKFGSETIPIVPNIGISINLKLNPSATNAFRVVDSPSGAGTNQYDIGFSGDYVDLDSIPSGDWWIIKLYNQGTAGSTYDLSFVGTQYAQIKKTGGVILKNGKAAMSPGNQSIYESGSAWSGLDDTSEFTIVSLASQDINTAGTILDTTGTNTDVFRHFVDARTTPNRNAQVLASGTSYFSNMSTARNNNNQQLKECVKTTTDVSSWDNGSAGDQNVSWSGSYNNTKIRCGALYSGFNSWNDTFQELLIYDSALSVSNRESIRDFLNNYYSVY